MRRSRDWLMTVFALCDGSHSVRYTVPNLSHLTIDTGRTPLPSSRFEAMDTGVLPGVTKEPNFKLQVSIRLTSMAESIVKWASDNQTASLAEWKTEINNGIQSIITEVNIKEPGKFKLEELEKWTGKGVLKSLKALIKKTKKGGQSVCPPGLEHGQSGVVCIEILDTAALKQARSDLKQEFDNFPEFVQKRELRIENGKIEEGGPSLWPTLENDDFLPVGGSFGALGNPSSFHNPFVRKMRRLVHYEVLKSGKVPIHGRNFEQIADRLLVRRPYKSPTAEAWHRDEAMFAEEGDDIYGGWLNLDATDQHFSFVPNTAFDDSVKGVNRGFAKLSEYEQPYCLWNSSLETIKPGHLMVFNERTIHEVLSHGHHETICRLFFGFRVTHGESPLTPGLDKRLDDQEALPIKSGQHPHPHPDASIQLKRDQIFPGPPPVYPQLYWANHPNKLELLAQYFHRSLLEVKHYGEHTKNREKYKTGVITVKRFFPSLEELGSKFDKYTDEEIAILKPGRRWTGLLDRESNEVDFALPDLVDLTF